MTSIGWKNFEEHDGKVLDCFGQTGGRNTNVNNSASKDSEGSKLRKYG